MITKQHFEALAKTLAAQRPSNQTPCYTQWYDDVIAVAAVCEIFNAAFNLKKFLSKVGFERSDIERYCR